MNEMITRNVPAANTGTVADVKYGANSLNALYEWRDGSEPNVVARYRKTVAYMVSGFRRNPNDNSEEVFILKTADQDFAFGGFNAQTKHPSYWRFNYDSDVVELYSEFEHKRFLQRNKQLLDEGILVPYDNVEDKQVFDADPAESNPFEQEDTKEPEIIFGR